MSASAYCCKCSLFFLSSFIVGTQYAIAEPNLSIDSLVSPLFPKWNKKCSLLNGLFYSNLAENTREGEKETIYLVSICYETGLESPIVSWLVEMCSTDIAVIAMISPLV